MDADIHKIDQLLSEHKPDEARALIRELVSQKLTDTEKGGVLTGIASTYLAVSNAIQSRYLSLLEEAVSAMRKVNAAEDRSIDKVRLAQARAGLGM